ncbi:GNAT family N-acetyltransferase [Pseudonocardia kujensis]|uniref:GNAT family N-acetyltransferase n=1 Tax=Pseudonocardia kujensis TaxID=1128675 RepID=UPI001E64F7C0|nr:GNAT family N-acetyltransferase [Pseudonocardia kujensis]MCE0763902.1 GNAT family N-acetyltransferase [Pseudonocardia kujensis]
MGGFEIDDDPARLDRDAVWAWLSTDAYWGRWRLREHLERQLDAAWRVVGVYRGDRTLGSARAVSDGVSFAYLADVWVDPSVRGHGLGVALVETMLAGGPGMRWSLHTRDAHGLYTRFGFTGPDETLLERPADPEMILRRDVVAGGDEFQAEMRSPL